MADDLTEELGKNIPLSEMIESLRQEIAVAIDKGKGQSVHFEMGSVELEVKLVVKRSKAADGGVKFWVFTAKGKMTAEDEAVHRFKLTLTPKLRDGKPVAISRD